MHTNRVGKANQCDRRTDAKYQTYRGGSRKRNDASEMFRNRLAEKNKEILIVVTHEKLGRFRLSCMLVHYFLDNTFLEHPLQIVDVADRLLLTTFFTTDHNRTVEGIR